MAFYCVVTGVTRVRGLKRPYDLFVTFELKDDAVADFAEEDSFRLAGVVDMPLSDIRQAIREEFRVRTKAANDAAKSAATAAGGLIGFRYPAAP